MPHRGKEMKIKYPNITVQLSDADGNAFNLIGMTKKALRRGGADKEDIATFQTEAMSGDYDNVLQTIMKWVDTA